METFADKSETSRLVLCAKCGRPNRIPIAATAANCGECKTPLTLPTSAPTASADATLNPADYPHLQETAESTGTASVVTAASSVQSHRDIRAEEIKTGNTGYGWVIAAVTGAVVISVLRHSPDAVRLVAPCVVMLLYFAWGWQQDSRNKEKLADSLYFLGFIWTLYALIDALISGAGQAKDAAALFTAFGYALVTTGLGMFLRMVVIQLAYSAPEQIEDTRDAVAQGLDQFRVSLKDAQNALVLSRNQFTKTSEAWVAMSREVATALKHASVETSESARTAVERVVSGLQEVSTAVESCGESSKIASRAVSSMAKRVATSGEKLTETLDQSSSVVAAGLASAATQLSQVDIPSNIVAVRLNGLVDEMVAPSKAVLASMSTMSASAVTAQRNVSSASNTAAQGMSNVAQHVDRLGASVQAIEQSIERLRVSLTAISEKSETLARTTGQLIDVQTTLANRLQAIQQPARTAPPQQPSVSADARRWPWSR